MMDVKKIALLERLEGIAEDIYLFARNAEPEIKSVGADVDVDELKDYSRDITAIVRELSLLEGEEWWKHTKNY